MKNVLVTAQFKIKNYPIVGLFHFCYIEKKDVMIHIFGCISIRLGQNDP